MPCLMLPQMLLWWLVHTYVCSTLMLPPEFFFEMKDSRAGHCFVATNLHLENSLGAKASACSPQLWAPHLARWHALPKEFSQLCSNMMKCVGEEKQSIRFPSLFCTDFPDPLSLVLVRTSSHQKSLNPCKYPGI